MQPVESELLKENICPQCRLSLILLRSHSKKVCVNCNKEYAWHLNENQQPLIKHQR